MSLARSIAARMLARKATAAPARAASAKAPPVPSKVATPSPKRAPRPAQAAAPHLPPRSEPDLRELVESFAPPPAPSAPPPAPVLLPGWRGNCHAVNPATGRRCALLAGHGDTHRHGSTPFRFGAEPGQRFTRREELDAAATRNPHEAA